MRSRIKCNPSGDTYYYSVAAGGSGTAAAATYYGAAVDSVSAARTLQPFDTSPTEAVITATVFKSPDMKMAATAAPSLEFPFTIAQWKELERQAMIYKYMMASVPVPPHLLLPTSRNLHSDPAAAASLSSLGSGGLNLKYTNGADLEPGRCRRTDGKKWRCSRDAAPDQKYCERHMHRGRPRSRKPVELLANTNNNKKIRYNYVNNHTNSAQSPVAWAVANKNGAADSQFLGSIAQPYVQAPVFLDKPSTKVADFDGSMAFASNFKESRSLQWMMKGEAASIATADQQWPGIGLSSDCSFNPEYQREALNLNSFGDFSAGEDQRNNQSRGFIDAWSNVASDKQSDNSGNTNSSFTSSGLLSLGINSINDEMSQIQMGLGLVESDQNHGSSIKPLALAPAAWPEGATVSPGGPLAEVLQLSSGNTVVENGDPTSPPATAASSPSGVLQRTLASFSDSSANSSPTLGSSVRDKSEIALMWLN
ncbi:growth-regulating factor 7 isoform X2 [Ricinus communis]|uniref:Growth-regulating factor n=2 Tax=Ricinus communis TaxID=3988 RepID=B9S7G3_RICCO|nr:growth-regulating factor 7 isoform X2 [Ricinus communis]EEF40456.1 conserved hypothetical protein [Ricinus communis]